MPTGVIRGFFLAWSGGCSTRTGPHPRSSSPSSRTTSCVCGRGGGGGGGGGGGAHAKRPDPRGTPAPPPDWSPLGDLVAYVTDVNIYLVRWDAVGFDEVQLTTAAPNADPDWSPDGKWIAFESWREAANHDIYIMATNGSSVTPLTNDPTLDYQPAWRP